MSALRLINETELTSGVSSFSVTDIFTEDFDLYKVVLSDWVSTNGYWYLRPLNSSGSVITSGNDFATQLQQSHSSFVEYRGTNTASLWSTSNICYSEGNNGVFYFFNPYSIGYTFVLGQYAGFGFGNNLNTKNIGVQSSTTRVTGIQITQQSAGTFSSGKVRTYGLRVDS